MDRHTRFHFRTGSSAPGTIHAIAFASSEGGCNTYAYGNRGGEIYLTRDGGVTWTDLDPTTMLPARPINSIVFDPTSAIDRLCRAVELQRRHARTAGTRLQVDQCAVGDADLDGHQPRRRRAVQRARDRPAQSQSVYTRAATAACGRPADGGTTWNKQGLAVGIPNVPVHDIQINPTTDSTIAFTYGRGAYRLVTAATTVHPPSNLRVQSVLGSTVTVSFTPPDDGLTPTGYVLEGGTTPGQVLAGLPIAAGTSTLTFQAPTGAFYIRVHALSGALRSVASNEVRLFVNVSGGARRRGESVVAGRWQHRLTRVDEQRQWRGLNRAPHRRSRRVEHVGAHPRDREHHGQQRTAGSGMNCGCMG